MKTTNNPWESIDSQKNVSFKFSSGIKKVKTAAEVEKQTVYTLKDVSPENHQAIIFEHSQKKKSKAVYYVIWLFLGIFGGHQFYMASNNTENGKLHILWGIIYLFTFGGFGIGWAMDVFGGFGVTAYNKRSLSNIIKSYKDVIDGSGK